VTRLFVALYLDEDVDVLIATLLRARGFEVATTQEAGQISADDDVQLAYAVGRQMAMLTHNRVDYEALAAQYYAAGQPHCGIIISGRRPPYEIARRLLKILNAITADEMDNQLRYI
jgi:predicted nuclease of predicted toxin-antitoxin system